MAKKSKGNRIQVILECTEQRAAGIPGASRYMTYKNPQSNYRAFGVEKIQPEYEEGYIT